MKKILLNILSVLLAVAVFYFLGREFLKNWEHIRLYSFHFDVLFVLLASVCYAATFVGLGVAWYLIFCYLHHPVPLFEAVLYFCITQPAKYIPGKVWLAIGRMKFCKSHGVPNSITLLSTGTEAVFEVLAGAYVSIIAILQTPVLGKFSLPGTILISGCGLLLLIPRVFYFFINIYLKIVKREPIGMDRHASFLKLLLLQLVYAAGMIGLGLSQALFLKSFIPVSFSNFPFLIGIGALSYSIGIIAVFSPGGLGVREATWHLALKRIIAPHIALLYSFVSRLWIMIVEVILMSIACGILWIKRHLDART